MKRLRMLRKARGITQDQLGDVIGVSGMAVSSYENGKREPSFEILKSIANYFEVTVDYLIERTDSKEPAYTTSPPDDPKMAFGASLKDGMSYEDLNPKGKAELYEYFQYLRQKYPKGE